MSQDRFHGDQLQNCKIIFFAHTRLFQLVIISNSERSKGHFQFESDVEN